MSGKGKGGKYLSVSREIEELKSSSSDAGGKAMAGAALAGKGIVNLGKFLLKNGPPVLEKVSADMKDRIETEKRRRGE